MPNETPWIISAARSGNPQMKRMNGRALATKVGKLAAKRGCTASTIFADAYSKAGKSLSEGIAAFDSFYESLKAGYRAEIPPLVLKYCQETWNNQLVCDECGANFDFPSRFITQGANGSAPRHFCTQECFQRASPLKVSARMAEIIGLPPPERQKQAPSPRAASNPTGPPQPIQATRDANTTEQEYEMGHKQRGGQRDGRGEKPLDSATGKLNEEIAAGKAEIRTVAKTAGDEARAATMTLLKQAKEEIPELGRGVEKDLRERFEPDFARLETLCAALKAERERLAQVREEVSKTLEQLKKREAELAATIASAKEAEAKRAERFADIVAELQSVLASAGSPSPHQEETEQEQPAPALAKRRGRPRRERPFQTVADSSPPAPEPAQPKPVEQSQPPDEEDLGHGLRPSAIREMTTKVARRWLQASGLSREAKRLLRMKVRGEEI